MKYEEYRRELLARRETMAQSDAGYQLLETAVTDEEITVEEFDKLTGLYYGF